MRGATLILIVAISGCTIQSSMDTARVPRPHPTTFETVYGVYENDSIDVGFTLENKGEGPLEWISVKADFSPRKEVISQTLLSWSNDQSPSKQRFNPSLKKGDRIKVRVSVAAAGLAEFLRENRLLLADMSGGLCIYYNDMQRGDADGTIMPLPVCIGSIRMVTLEEYRRIVSP